MQPIQNYFFSFSLAASSSASVQSVRKLKKQYSSSNLDD